MQLRQIMLPLLCAPLLCLAELAPEKTVEIELAAKKVHEECMDLTPGQNLLYRFEASGELDFNLHFHQGDKVTYLVKEKYSNYASSYEAEQENGFCLMWENSSSEPVKLQIGYQVDTPAAK
jgi:hypothetical protein